MSTQFVWVGGTDDELRRAEREVKIDEIVIPPPTKKKKEKPRRSKSPTKSKTKKKKKKQVVILETPNHQPFLPSAPSGDAASMDSSAVGLWHGTMSEIDDAPRRKKKSSEQRTSREKKLSNQIHYIEPGYDHLKPTSSRRDGRGKRQDYRTTYEKPRTNSSSKRRHDQYSNNSSDDSSSSSSSSSSSREDRNYRSDYDDEREQQIVVRDETVRNPNWDRRQGILPDFSDALGQESERPNANPNRVDYLDTVGSGVIGWSYFDKIFLSSLFDPTTAPQPVKRASKDDVKIKVLATTLLPLMKHQEPRDPGADIDELIRQSNFIGEVTKVPLQGNIGRLEPGDYVTSIRKCATSTRTAMAPANSLIPLPGKLDPGEAAAVVSIFLPAFSALHHGHRKSRYLKSSLKGKSVLVTGGFRLDAQAVAKLALWGGAERVYILDDAVKSRRDVPGKGVTVLPHDPEKWLPELYQQMDVVIDYHFPRYFQNVLESMKDDGRLVCLSKAYKRQNDDWKADLEEGWFSGLENIVETAAFCFMRRSYLFNYDEICTHYEDELKEDLAFLMRLLEKRQIRPHIDRFVTRQDIRRVREEMKMNANNQCKASGTIICEPWRDEEEQHPVQALQKAATGFFDNLMKG